ncbi:MAG: lysine--tRNA ligase [Planctomycetota bacterium]
MADNNRQPPHDQRKVRLTKLEKIRAEGVHPYPDRFSRTHAIAQARMLKPGTEGVRTAGRIVLVRVMGKLTFAHIQDIEAKIQISLRRDVLGAERYKRFKQFTDIGDFIGVEGKIFLTKTGELTIDVSDFTLLSKALRPLPEKWHGLADVEACYRQRYLDLIMNEETRRRFVLRSRVISAIRGFLDVGGFVEVDTPVIQTRPSGARARPFITHHNALDMSAYLRIAPETYLKRLIVAGFDKVYEFARCFRNEGMDPSHLQDFTMLEYYCAYWNYEDNIVFTEKLVRHVVREIFGALKVKHGDREMDFDGEWPRMSFRELILRDAGIDIEKSGTIEALRGVIREKGIEIENVESLNRAALIDSLYKKVSQPNIINPLFLVGYPIELSPLARRSEANPAVTDRFQLVVNGREIVNAYSELIDPIDQRKRFEEQARMLASGDEEAMPMDEDYLLAMEYGMPPNSGWGMGIDRFVALLADCDNLRDVVLFPLMKPIHSESERRAWASDPAPRNTAKQEEGECEKGALPPPGGVETVDIDDAGITRERAMELLLDNISTDVLRKHCLASGAVMKALAERLGKNAEVWEIAGLVHDLDFDRVQEPDKHTLETAEILRGEGADPALVQAVLAHNAEGLAPHGVERKTDFDYALTCAEAITGLVVATALIQPDKKLASVKSASVVKRMKKKDFARKVSREAIMFCEKIGLTVEEFADISLRAMQGISDDLGL